MPGYHPGEGAPSGKPYRGLCVFDMDNTLTRDMLSTSESCGTHAPTRPSWHLPPHGILPVTQYPAVYAKEAVARCLHDGFAVGVATAAPCAPPPALGDPGGQQAKSSLHSRMAFLRDIGMPPQVADAKGKQGPAYQCIDTDDSTGRLKSRMVGNLMSYYGVPAKKTVFFDDQQKFLDEVKSVHPQVTTQLASARECHGKVCLKACGLRQTEFERGVGTVMLSSDKESAARMYDTMTGSKGKGRGHIGAQRDSAHAPVRRAAAPAGPPLGQRRGELGASAGALSARRGPLHHHHHPRHHH
eukprot:TRINITY_DN2323_c0_g1_i2.p1 TRINITY_DN2323_c0_g1~~TRINITY_DN2323_c0_g1_i2.p1  ORF type:complete len:299 (+),score=60.56 TRINITY_DN2323_c0_g1_i2:147-1043(+)